MNWKKRGLIFTTRGQYSWNRTHAQLPIVDVQHKDKWRIYYASRDNQNQSHICYLEVQPGEPENIIYEHNLPVITLGRLGSFDESGTMPVCIVNKGALKYLYYAGWSLKRTVPYHNSIGLALSRDGGKTFERVAEGPLFDRKLAEPYFNGTAHTVVEDGLWRMWYQSCTRWEIIEGIIEPFYHIKYAESRDGIHWKREGLIAIDYADEDEGGISSASVLKEHGLYKMWYSTRSASGFRYRKENSYRIGYAESSDGIRWRRRDSEAGISTSESGWDSDMIAYPCIVEYRERKYMFYNGNGFGRSGFGYAVSED